MNVLNELAGQIVWPKLPLKNDSGRKYFPTDNYLIKLIVTQRGQVRGQMRMVSPDKKEKAFMDVSLPHAYFDLDNPRSFIRESMNLLDPHIPVDGLCLNAPVTVNSNGTLYCQPDTFLEAMRLPEDSKKKVYLLPSVSIQIQPKDTRLQVKGGAVMAGRTTQKEYSVLLAGKEVFTGDLPKMPEIFGLRYDSSVKGFHKIMSSLVENHLVLEDNGKSKIVLPKLRRDNFRVTVLALEQYWTAVDKKCNINTSFNGEEYADDQLEALYSILFPYNKLPSAPASPTIEIFL